YSSIEVKPNHEINFILGPYGQHAQIELFKWLDGLRLKYTDTPLSPRFVMQTFGTDFARALDPNIWSLNAIKSSLEILNGGYTYYRTVGLRESENKYDYVALLDIRFRNEILNLNKINAGVWKLYRKVPEVQNGIKNHASETGLDNIPRHFYDEVIDNNKTLKHLYDEIDGHMAINYGDDRVWR
ncbi:MAG TPA: hypothetical protein VHD33_06520, partial [Legionellaceae bacterium]|nr:hypothetical protein [Legionellaceae bacterium]